MMDMASDEAARQAMRAETIKYAVIVVSSVPMLIIYPFVQRFFVKGVMIGSVKG
jgi:putative aldouronate transport system permease protein